MSGLMVDAARCVGCKRCERACAFGGIVVEGRLARPTDACTLCGGCVEACPVDAISIERDEAGEGPGCDLSAYRDIWVIAQVDAEGALLPVVFELVGKALELAEARGCQVVAVLGEAGRAPRQAERLAATGVAEVIHAVDERLAHADAEVFAQWICALAEERRPETMLFGATAFGRELAPRVAVRLQTGLTADCTALDIDPKTGALLQTRPAFGGNLMATIECPAHRPQMATVRPGVFAAPECVTAGAGAGADLAAGIITQAPLAPEVALRVTVLGIEPVIGGSIAQAERLVVVGRGIGSKKNLPLMERLAELLHAELGCTRPLVEAGWLDYAHQVGQTGAAVAPKLLVSIGVSGAIQHLAGIGGAETVVAINEDAAASIFGVADHAVVGDAVEVVTELIAQLEARN
ncbi:MAG: electron transfer flavoprotein subunit alpha [Enorma sp.]|uniref:electron transfer flavoprotein subunit alpha n=1 Tax=Enorma sp. TaxID=1920692 RepID=UPI0025900157|nr:electron transfer flavoprotein subunit alpha [Enorma sp.]MCI7775534.1 electron transfer flavoprotein subunit alpha [Enorma sp.]